MKAPGPGAWYMEDSYGSVTTHSAPQVRQSHGGVRVGSGAPVKTINTTEGDECYSGSEGGQTRREDLVSGGADTSIYRAAGGGAQNESFSVVTTATDRRRDLTAETLEKMTAPSVAAAVEAEETEDSQPPAIDQSLETDEKIELPETDEVSPMSAAESSIHKIRQSRMAKRPQKKVSFKVKNQK